MFAQSGISFENKSKKKKRGKNVENLSYPLTFIAAMG